jgi:hypothetical protein
MAVPSLFTTGTRIARVAGIVLAIVMATGACSDAGAIDGILAGSSSTVAAVHADATLTTVDQAVRSASEDNARSPMCDVRLRAVGKAGSIGEMSGIDCGRASEVWLRMTPGIGPPATPSAKVLGAS